MPRSRPIRRTATGKLTIIGVEGAASSVTVVSQFNPKEISVDRSVPWQLQQAKGPGDLAFTSAEGRSMSFELMFDGVESRTHIQDEIGTLQRLSEADPSLKRPPKVKIVWGASPGRARRRAAGDRLAARG